MTNRTGSSLSENPTETYLHSLVSFLFRRGSEKAQGEEAFEVGLSKHELPDWLKGLDSHKENMTILHGISMCVSGGGHYSYSGCMGAFKAGRNVLSNIKRATIDFELAKLFPSPFGHVEMSLAVPRGREIRTGIVSGYSTPAPTAQLLLCGPNDRVRGII